MEKENMVANRLNTLTEELIENLAVEIREGLIIVTRSTRRGFLNKNLIIAI